MKCGVRGCGYIAEAVIEDFAVCLLHDSPKVRAILEELKAPHACWWPDGRPIVLPCGDLTEDDLKAREGGTMSAADDPRMADVPTTPASDLHPCFDLTR